MVRSTIEAPECANAVENVDVNRTQAVTINADGTYQTQGSVNANIRYAFTLDCVSALAGEPLTDADMPEFCSGLETMLNDPTEETSIDSATCGMSGSTCRCQVTSSDQINDTGTWVVDGTSVITTDNEGETSEASFCVQGNQMQTEESDDDLTVVATYQRS